MSQTDKGHFKDWTQLIGESCSIFEFILDWENWNKPVLSYSIISCKLVYRLENKYIFFITVKIYRHSTDCEPVSKQWHNPYSVKTLTLAPSSL